MSDDEETKKFERPDLAFYLRAEEMAYANLADTERALGTYVKARLGRIDIGDMVVPTLVATRMQCFVALAALGQRIDDLKRSVSINFAPRRD